MPGQFQKGDAVNQLFRTKSIDALLAASNEEGKRLKDGFSFTSDRNTRWIREDEIRGLLECG